MNNRINWKEVPIPANMQLLEKDKRGLPVPFVVLKDNKGQHHFKINDTLKVNRCFAEGLCSICGKALGHNMWLIGGPMSAFHEDGAYIDPPMHYACAEYALKVCPYLAVSTYNNKQTVEDMVKGFDHMMFVNHTQTMDRVPFFVVIKIGGYKLTVPEGYVKPNLPFLELEFWNDGVQITEQDARQILIDANT